MFAPSNLPAELIATLLAMPPMEGSYEYPASGAWQGRAMVVPGGSIFYALRYPRGCGTVTDAGESYCGWQDWTFSEDSPHSDINANYDSQGRFIEYFAEDNGWRQFLTAVAIAAPAIAGVYSWAAAGGAGGAAAVAPATIAPGAAGPITGISPITVAPATVTPELLATLPTFDIAAGSVITTGANMNVTDYWDFAIDQPWDSVPIGGELPPSFDVLPPDWGFEWGAAPPDVTIAAEFPLDMPVAPDFPIPEITIAPGGAPMSSGITFTDVLGTVKNVTSTALQVASTVRAFQQSGQRLQDPTAANRAADGSSGLILTRDASGRVVASRPAAGVATVTSDGGMIINRGDGTYEYIGPDGSRVTRRYGGGASPATGGTNALGLDRNMLIFGGAAAVLAVIALARR